MENQKLEKTLLSDSELSEVSGGAAVFCTKNSSFYSSGDVPKYHKGQRVFLQYKADLGGLYDLTCIVEDVTETAECGTFYKEFGYTVKVISVPEGLSVVKHSLLGHVETGVYESCLRPA